MQQHQGGGSQYGAPPQPQDMGPFSAPPAPGPVPLSSRPPAPTQQQQQPTYEELAAASGAGAGGGGFPDDDMLGGDSGGNSGGGLGASGGNRWPREETLALIRIRSEMDATFRDATLKGPLWEEVSRKLAELGYKRNAKKCKEKFENVHKYYKRTKEGRTGRQDGKSYRFFSELEALHATTTAQHHQEQQLPPVSSAPAPPQLQHAFAAPAVSAPLPMSTMPPPPGLIQPAPISSAAPAAHVAELHQPPPPLALQGLSFPSMSGSESDDESEDDDEMTAETGGGSGSQDGLGKRKHGGSKKLMAFFEGLMKQVIQRQEEMQRRFLETMKKREAERMAREEAWRKQEVARLNHEQEILAHERAAAASRDASIIAFLQRVGGGQAVQVPAPVVIPMPAPMQVQTPRQPPRQQLPPPPPPPAQTTPQPPQPIPAAPLQQQPPPPQPQHKETTTRQEPVTTPRSAPTPTPASGGTSMALVPVAEQQHVETHGLGGGDHGGAASSSRWPKTEVHALIQLRMDMDNRYQENGPKGPLWEEISSGMRRLGYNRNPKRCKEKWENINKYFKKVKESSRSKQRPVDSKTCPYFHQLDKLYQTKAQHAAASQSPTAQVAAVTVLAAVPLSSQTPAPHIVEHGLGNNCTNGLQVKASNGNAAERFFPSVLDSAGRNGTPANKLESKQDGTITKETTEQQQPAGIPMAPVNNLHNYGNGRTEIIDDDDMDDSDSMDDDFDSDDDEDVVGGTRNAQVQSYDILFQSHQQQNTNGGGGGNPPAGPAPPASAAATSSGAPAPFLAMVQ